MRQYLVEVYSDDRCSESYQAWADVPDEETLETRIICSPSWDVIASDHYFTWKDDFEEDELEEFEETIAPHVSDWHPENTREQQYLDSLPVIYDERVN